MLQLPAVELQVQAGLSLPSMQGLKQDEKLGLGSLVLAGGLAGVFYWGPVYPADIVKSKIQVDDFKHPQYSGSIDCAVKVSTSAE